MMPPLHARRQQTSAEHFCSRLLWATQGMKRTMQLRTRVVLYGEVSIFLYSSILSKQVCFLHILFAMQVYHSVLPNYILKRIRFSILGMIGHAHLAALDDVNVNRRHSTTKKTNNYFQNETPSNPPNHKRKHFVLKILLVTLDGP